jgi:CRISPR/Cas system CSM-associated protein Csm5 (group 7 of RAMP superfamily)
MSKFLNISPVHIGSGETYENYLIHGKNRYSFDQFLSHGFKENKERFMDSVFLKSLENLGQNKSGKAKEKIRNILVPSAQFIKTLEPLYEVDIKLQSKRLNEKSIFAFVKTMNRPYIPGSSFKGYLMNVLLYDMFKNDQEIQEHIQKKLEMAAEQWQKNSNKKIEKTKAYAELRMLEHHALIEAGQHLMCRDIIFDKPMAIFYISGQPKKGDIPIVAECLYDDIEVNYDDIVINDIKHQPTYNSNIEEKMAQALITRIKNLKDQLYAMNREYILNTIAYQKAFINKHKKKPNSKINHRVVMDQFDYIEKRLNERKIVIQLGKYTNYITKSSGMGLGLDFYEHYFKQVFKPHADKDAPNIASMNLTAYESNDRDFDQIPGYMIFEW